jgi:hypothetical protein
MLFCLVCICPISLLFFNVFLNQNYELPENIIFWHFTNGGHTRKSIMAAPMFLRIKRSIRPSLKPLIKTDFRIRCTVEQEVVIALQLENGERLQGSFLPTITLRDLLLYWESNSDKSYYWHQTECCCIPILPCCFLPEHCVNYLTKSHTFFRSSNAFLVWFEKKSFEKWCVTTRKWREASGIISTYHYIVGSVTLLGI